MFQILRYVGTTQVEIKNLVTKRVAIVPLSFIK
jgi:hypothetical protein